MDAPAHTYTTLTRPPPHSPGRATSLRFAAVAFHPSCPSFVPGSSLSPWVHLRPLQLCAKLNSSEYINIWSGRAPSECCAFQSIQ